MPVLNHHIVSARDSEASARYYSEVLGLGAPVKLGHFAVLGVGPDTTLDFVDASGDLAAQHYAFLVTEEEFDEVFGRVTERGQEYWADPMHEAPGEINHWDDGRGMYFDDPDGHRLEILTRSYGAGGTEADHVHPLVAPPIEGAARRDVH
jgi:catechol 2,3-dioxygenase-like lactoylglutathione lyase family enzyme